MSVKHYLRLLETRTEELLDQSPPMSHPHSLAAAIRMSTDRLAEVDPAALALLRIGAFFAPEPFPTDVLLRPIAMPGGARPPEQEALAAVAGPIAARRSIGLVRNYGLPRLDGGLQLHRLTRAILRNQLNPDATAAYQAYAHALLAAADPGDYQDPACWPGWAKILPHLMATDPATSSSPELRKLARRAIWYLHNCGDNYPARDLAEHLYRRWSERLGSDNRHTLGSAHALVRVLIDVGVWRLNWQHGCPSGEPCGHRYAEHCTRRHSGVS